MSVWDTADLVVERQRLREAGQVVVQCHGCFDIVHPGHVRYLRFARSLGDVLVVSVTSDRCIDKGFDRPYFHEALRTESLAALEFVDYVCLDDHVTATEILTQLQPDVYVKGKEYETSEDPRFLVEKKLVEAYGGRVVYSSGDVVFSSTRLLERLRSQVSMDAEKIRVFAAAHGVDRPALEDLLARIAELRVVVVGDPIIDRYIHSEEVGIASEGPIITVAPIGEELFAGGAGLIASQAAHLGARTTLVTTLDGSERAQLLSDLLEQSHVTVQATHEPRRPVFLKSRYVVQGQKVLKVDEGQRVPLSSTGAEAFVAAIEGQLDGCDLIIATDFGHGLFAAPVIEGLGRLASERGVPLAIDVSRSGSSNLMRFRGTRLATPTEDELRLALGDLEAGLSNLASRYYQATGGERLVITMGSRGSLMLGRGLQGSGRLIARHLPAFTSHPLDTVGAGDVFLASLALADAAGGSPELGLYLGSLVASLHVQRLGNRPTPMDLLTEGLHSRAELLG